MDKVELLCSAVIDYGSRLIAGGIVIEARRNDSIIQWVIGQVFEAVSPHHRIRWSAG